MGAALERAALFEHDHLVRSLQTSEPVSDQERRPVRRGVNQVGHQGIGGWGVKVLARFVGHEHGKVGE